MQIGKIFRNEQGNTIPELLVCLAIIFGISMLFIPTSDSLPVITGMDYVMVSRLDEALIVYHDSYQEYPESLNELQQKGRFPITDLSKYKYTVQTDKQAYSIEYVTPNGSIVKSPNSRL